MSLIFQNSYSATATISVCVLFFDSSCPNPWRKAGWYNAGPGQSVTVLTNSLESGNYYFYAFATDGAVWEGGSGSVSVDISNPVHFNACWLDDGGDNSTVQMVHFVVGADTHTQILLPLSGVPFDNFSNFQNFSNFGNF